MPLTAGIYNCIGDERKINVLMVREVPRAQRCVIFFPGDITDFATPDSPYPYSLEALMWVLCGKYPEDTVVAVKPRMMVNLFAAYVNFMFVDGTGNPRPVSEITGAADPAAEEGKQNGAEGSAAPPADSALQPPRAVAHLWQLLRSLETATGQALPKSLTLVGFSKGAAVLGALIRGATEANELWQQVSSVHFVDAGLTVPGVFPVTSDELEALKRSVADEFTVWIHGTPRQLQDVQRPFVAEEATAFTQRCRDAGLKVERRLYADGQAPGLEMHFDCLRCFDTCDKDPDGGDRHSGFFSTWNEACCAA